MIKRIITISIIYSFVTLMIMLNMSKIENFYISLLAISSLAFVIILFKEIKPHLQPKNDQVSYDNFESVKPENFKKISRKPFLFGIEKGFVNEDEFYFDENYLYAIKKNQKTSFKLTDIIALDKTNTRIGNRYIWQIIIKEENNKEVIYKFVHNYTLFNKNFYKFHEKIKTINSNAVKAKWTIWNL